jgi:hypothetical protein
MRAALYRSSKRRRTSARSSLARSCTAETASSIELTMKPVTP